MTTKTKTKKSDSVREPAYPCSKFEQNGHTIYLLSVPVDDLSGYCTTSLRSDGSSKGYQRGLSEKRTAAIAEYLADGSGLVPSNIVLAAQEKSRLEYNGNNKTIAFDRVPGAFFVIDGQHRLGGYALCATKHRVPIAIIAGLSAAMQAKIFIDVNTLQEPVPRSLLLDIKSIAGIENEREDELRKLYDRLGSDPASPLHEKVSPTGTDKTKLSRVTFNRAVAPLLKTALKDVQGMVRYELLRNYLRAVEERFGIEDLLRPAVLTASCQVMRDAIEVCAEKHDDARIGSLRKTAECFTRVLLRDENGRAVPAAEIAEQMRAALRPPLALRKDQIDETSVASA